MLHWDRFRVRRSLLNEVSAAASVIARFRVTLCACGCRNFGSIRVFLRFEIHSRSILKILSYQTYIFPLSEICKTGATDKPLRGAGKHAESVRLGTFGAAPEVTYQPVNIYPRGPVV